MGDQKLGMSMRICPERLSEEGQPHCWAQHCLKGCGLDQTKYEEEMPPCLQTRSYSIVLFAFRIGEGQVGNTCFITLG